MKEKFLDRQALFQRHNSYFSPYLHNTVFHRYFAENFELVFINEFLLVRPGNPPRISLFLKVLYLLLNDFLEETLRRVLSAVECIQLVYQEEDEHFHLVFVFNY